MGLDHFNLCACSAGPVDRVLNFFMQARGDDVGYGGRLGTSPQIS